MKAKNIIFILISIFISLLTLTGSAHASCSGTTGIMNIDIGTITILGDADNSTSIEYKDLLGTKADVETAAAISCSGYFTYVGKITNPVPGTNDLEKALLSDGSWSGLGFKFYTRAYNGWYNSLHNASPPVTIAASWNKFCMQSECWNPQSHEGIIMIGALSVYGGGVPAMPGIINTTVTPFTTDGYPAITYHITGTVVVPSCNVDAATPSRVLLKPVNANDLSHKGSTAEDTPFEISLKCNSNVSVNLLLDGTEDSDAQDDGVLALNGNSTASGVGVQLLVNNNPAKLNETFKVGDAVAGNTAIAMTARYYRTSNAAVKAGSVSATVVYNVTYK
ncbi:fimbrial protein [Citrobacter enshiensis]|uniref:fimbrial protein n=1 Tax=Citrobacter enshiensis TaxID=2971264 RepID=UPI0023E7CFAF|nr:fimbrial protein [Citrobacter enshiensis]WET42559.1 fimbrial protein [Citrobacter enshiensis]